MCKYHSTAITIFTKLPQGCLTPTGGFLADLSATCTNHECRAYDLQLADAMNDL